MMHTSGKFVTNYGQKKTCFRFCFIYFENRTFLCIEMEVKHLCISNNKMLNAFQIEKQVKKVEGTYLEGDEHFYGVKRNFKDRYICINCINIKYVCKRFQNFL